MANSLVQLHQSALGLSEGAYIYSLASCGDVALAAISSDNSLRCFDRRTLKLMPDGASGPIHVGQEDASGATCLCEVSSGNEAAPLLATSGRDGSVKVWDIRTAKRGAVAEFSTGKMGRRLLLCCCCFSVIYACACEVMFLTCSSRLKR